MSIDQTDIDQTGAWLRNSLERMLNIIDDESPPFGYKVCSSCRRLLKVESFYRFHRSRDGRLGRCKSCFLSKRGGHKRERGGGEAGKSTPTTVADHGA